MDKKFAITQFDFFKKNYLFLVLGILLVLFPRLFYGISIFNFIETPDYLMEISEIGFFQYFVNPFSLFFSATSKLSIYCSSLLLSAFLAYLAYLYIFQLTSARRYGYFGFLLIAFQPLLVWVSGDPQLVYFSGALFLIGVLITLMDEGSLPRKTLLTLFLFLSGSLIDRNIYSYVVLFYIFYLIEVLNNNDKNAGNSKQSYLLVLNLIIFMAINYYWRAESSTEGFSLTIASRSAFLYDFIYKEIFTGYTNVFAIFNRMLDVSARISMSLVKAYFSPLIIITPLVSIIFFLSFKSFFRKKGISTFCLLSIFCCVFEMPYLHEGNYYGLIPAVFLSTLVLVAALREIFLITDGKIVRAVVIFLLPIVLIIGLFARGYRDYYRLNSVKGILKIIEKEVPIEATLYTPYGRMINVKGFKNLIKRKQYKIRALMYLRKNEIKKLMTGHDEVYIFLDDYYINHFYWIGKFWTKIKSENHNGIRIKNLNVISENSPNTGYFLKLNRE